MTDTPSEATATPARPPLDPQQWVERHGGYLYRYALAKVRRADVAEDLVQEALLAAWRGRAEYSGRAAERSWLTAILKRKVIDWLRRAVRARRHEDATEDAWEAAQFTAAGKWRRTPARWVTAVPDSDAERGEFWHAVFACAGRLPERLRDAFVLRHLDDRPTADVCRAVGVTPNNLCVMLHRARLRLWRCLSANWFAADAPPGRDGS